MGNTLVFLGLVDALLSKSGVTKADTYIDGDNAILFCEAEEENLLYDNCSSFCETVGFSVTLENRATYPEAIVFGQSRPVCVDGCWRMVRDWRKVLSGGTTSHRYLFSEPSARSWLAGVAVCESNASHGLPIMSTWASRLAELAVTKPKSMKPHEHYRMMGIDPSRVKLLPHQEPSMETRVSFALAFDCPTEYQLYVESTLRNSMFSYDIKARQSDTEVWGDCVGE